jgi:hypothetical protein
MKNEIMLNTLQIDNLGRIILTDDIINLIEDHDQLISSGGTNWRCNGTANGSCSNALCSESLNGSCTNQSACGSSANAFSCQNPDVSIPTNSNCS